MTRRSKRFERRQAKRIERRNLFIKKYDNYANVCNRIKLFEAADLAKVNVMWKSSVQNWSIHQLLNTERLYRDLLAGKDVRKGFSKFTINERGKIRHISAVRFYERIVQKALCKNVLYPVYTRSLVYDNGASQKGKGVKFSNDRLIKHLRRHFRKYGRNGYILLIDYKGYFENIDHDALRKIYRGYFTDPRLLKLIDDFVEAYGAKGLGLGSETSQMHAIAFPNKIDHAVIETLGSEITFGRYMDDSYIIAKNKSTLIKALEIIKRFCEKLKIILSPKKTKIVSLKNCFRYLKTIFHFSNTGRIIKKPYRRNVTRQRRKVKKQIRLYKAGKLGLKELRQSFESWAGSMLRRDARRTVWNMRRLFGKEIKLCHTKQKRKLTAALTLVNRNCSNMITPRAKWCLNLQQN